MEKKKLKCINKHAKTYNKPTLFEIGTVKEKTAGGQIDTPVDNSGWANKNTEFSGAGDS